MPTLIERVKAAALEKKKILPKLSIVQVGDRSDSNSYIKSKLLFARKIGVEVVHVKLPSTVSENELIRTIEGQNEDKSVTGIIVQLPLPVEINRDMVIASVDPSKDADGLTGKCLIGKVIPATARGVSELLSYYGIQLHDRKVVVVGRSMLVGGPITNMCRDAGAEVTVCHRGTVDLAAETRKADILIVAAGHPKLIREEHVKEGQIVIDVGISKDLEEKIVGDVDLENVSKIVAAISPVPGGVGPMTVCALFENLLDLSV